MKELIKFVEIEFVESYIKNGNDYQWNENHGELIRCKHCKYRKGCKIEWKINDNFFCAYGERKDDKKDA